jgi:predicted ATPase
MLTRVTLQNFKAFGERQSAVVAPLTLICGANSSGKSSLIQALLLIAQSAQSRDAGEGWVNTDGPHVALGPYAAIVHEHALETDIVIEVEYSEPSRTTPELPLGIAPPADAPRSVAVTLQSVHTAPFMRFGGMEPAGAPRGVVGKVKLRVGNALNAKFVRKASYYGGGSVGFNWADDESLVSFGEYASSRLIESRRERSPSASRISNGLKLAGEAGVQSRGWLPDAIDSNSVGLDVIFAGRRGHVPDPRRVREVERGLSIVPLLSNILAGVSADFYSTFQSFGYLGPIRERPKRVYGVSDVFDGLGMQGQNLAHLLSRFDVVTEMLNETLATMELPYQVELERLGTGVTGEFVSLILRDVRTNIRVSLADTGFGFSQLLPILVMGNTDETLTCCVEQPELHLHPKLQGQVADFFVKSAFPDNSRPQLGPRQWIVETHSEAIISRIQRRVREGKLASTDVSVLFVEPAAQGSRIISLRMDERGQFIDEWPGGFFEETYWDLFGGAQ